MEQETDLKPRLSVIVPALLGYETVLAALDSWEAQTCREQLEILVLCPRQPEAAVLQAGHVVLVTGFMHLHQARAFGIRQARADYVVLAEDHCLPDQQWAENVIARIAEGWDAIGPALRPGKPITKWAQGAFLVGYGQWMAPVAPGPVSVLPGHNSVLRKQPLLDLGAMLEHELIVCAFLMRRLRDQGLRFYLEARATMRHFDNPNGRIEASLLYHVGLGFGALRASSFPLPVRAAYSLALPLVAAKHFSRAVTQYFPAGPDTGLSPWCLLHTAVLAWCWATGEIVGAVEGVRRVEPRIQICEIKPISRDDARL